MLARLRVFFSNPIVNFGVGVAGIVIGVLASSYYSGGKRDLVYAVYPLRVYLARAERPSDLRVEYKGQPISAADVVAVQVGLWNQGDMSIRPENILEPIELVLKPPTQILEASILRHGRDVARLKLATDADAMNHERVPVYFKILEKWDGAIVQVIYAGPRDTRVELAGVVEGQAAARDLSPASKAPDERSAIEGLRAQRQGQTISLVVASVMLVMYLGLVIFQSLERHRAPAERRKSLIVYVIAFGATGIPVAWILVNAFWNWWASPIPPFVF